MKRRHLVLFVSLALGAGSAGISLLRAQVEQLALDPPLSDAFPSENVLNGVHVKYAVLLNDHTILHPEAILRFIYLDPNAGVRSHAAAGEDGGPAFRSHIGPGGSLTQGADTMHSRDGAAGGWGNADGNDVAGIYDGEKKDDAKRRKAEIQTEVWTQKYLFDDALERATELGTTLVYSVSPQGQPVTASIDLPEGMLLAEVNGHVQVLGIEEESRPYVGGVRPGDEIRSFNGGAPLKSLEDFLRAYEVAKRQAKVSGNITYAMILWRPDNAQTVSVQVAAPPAIPSFFQRSSPVDSGDATP